MQGLSPLLKENIDSLLCSQVGCEEKCTVSDKIDKNIFNHKYLQHLLKHKENKQDKNTKNHIYLQVIYKTTKLSGDA